MTQFILRRLFHLILVMLGASAVVFVLIRVIPGDPALIMLGEYATPEQLERAREQMGLHLPLYQQFGLWLVDLLKGNLGRSFRNNELIANEIMMRLPATLELGVLSLVLGGSTGVLFGVVAATRRRSWIDRAVMYISVIGIAVPVFWIGLMLVMAFSVAWPVLPLGGRIGATADLTGPTGFLLLDSLLHKDFHGLGQAARHLVLPLLTLSWHPLATLARVTRSSMLEVLQEDYVRTARSKGVSERRIIYRHALRNALIPVITVVGTTVGPLVGGAVLTETVFAWPGLGRYIVSVITARDFPAIQALILFSAFVFALANLIVDVAYVYVDPRIRYG